MRHLVKIILILGCRIQKLIQNTYGTGYYYLQDIDGDGNPDDKEESGDTNPYIGKPELEEVYDVDTTVKGSIHPRVSGNRSQSATC